MTEGGSEPIGFDGVARDRAVVSAETYGDLIYAAETGAQALLETAQYLDELSSSWELDTGAQAEACRNYGARLRHALRAAADYTHTITEDDEA